MQIYIYHLQSLSAWHACQQGHISTALRLSTDYYTWVFRYQKRCPYLVVQGDGHMKTEQNSGCKHCVDVDTTYICSPPLTVMSSAHTFCSPLIACTIS